MKNYYQKFYSSVYKDPSTRKKNTQNLSHAKINLKTVSFKKGRKVLDIACGVSAFGKMFGDEAYGFDLNLQAVKVSRKLGVIAKLGDVEKSWPYKSNFFDIVVASHIIEHVVNPDHLLLEAKRVLKKGGLLIILTPNLAAWFNRILLLVGIQPFFTEVSTLDKTLGMGFTKQLSANKLPVGHLRLFTPGALKDIVELHSFKVIQMTGLEFGSFPTSLSLLDKILSKVTTLSSSLLIVVKK